MSLHGSREEGEEKNIKTKHEIKGWKKSRKREGTTVIH
jgi:hypothetical protein